MYFTGLHEAAVYFTFDLNTVTEYFYQGNYVSRLSAGYVLLLSLGAGTDCRS